MNQREQLEQRIRDLTSQLSSSNSPVGDWKLAKILEYEKLGLESPYDFAEYTAARQAIRDEINEIQSQLAALPAHDSDDLNE